MTSSLYIEDMDGGELSPPSIPLSPRVQALFAKYQKDREDAYKAKSLAGVRAKASKRVLRRRRRRSDS